MSRLFTQCAHGWAIASVFAPLLASGTAFPATPRPPVTAPESAIFDGRPVGFELAKSLVPNGLLGWDYDRDEFSRIRDGGIILYFLEGETFVSALVSDGLGVMSTSLEPESALGCATEIGGHVVLARLEQRITQAASSAAPDAREYSVSEELLSLSPADPASTCGSHFGVFEREPPSFSAEVEMAGDGAEISFVLEHRSGRFSERVQVVAAPLVLVRGGELDVCGCQSPSPIVSMVPVLGLVSDAGQLAGVVRCAPQPHSLPRRTCGE